MASAPAPTSVASAPSFKPSSVNKICSNGSADNIHSFKASDLVVEMSQECNVRSGDVNLEGVAFGSIFTNHMLMVEWTAQGGWGPPHIKPFGPLIMHPACSALHYAVQLFEGMKAYRGPDDSIRLFRPQLNMKRMLKSAHRACLPAFDGEELLECIRRLVEVDQEWVPRLPAASLYIRPTYMGTEPSLGVKRASCALLYVIMSPVASYFSGGGGGRGGVQQLQSVSLWADSKYIRAWKGGTGDCKMGGNYGASIFVQHEAMHYGCQQVLWLYGDEHQITEVGTMNVFIYWLNEKGEEELATPPLDGIILPGITRQSILELTKSWGEFGVCERYITMSDLQRALEEQRLKEMFGSGTACVISPVGRILYQEKELHIPCPEKKSVASRLLDELTSIQYGRTPSEWSFLI